MNSAKLESEVISIICFLAVSARELMNDPKIYGPMRLMETTQRLIEMAEKCGVRNELFTEVAKRIEEAPLNDLPNSEDEFSQFMNDLISLLVTWVKQS